MQEFYSLLKMLADMGNESLINELYTYFLKIFPVFSDPEVDTNLTVNLANLSKELSCLSNGVVNASTLELRRADNGTELIRLYRVPRKEEDDDDEEEAPPHWLVRVPVGGKNNWCALYALGLSGNQSAENVIESHSGQWIDADYQAFWEEMSQISGSAIEIYTALDYGPGRPRSGTLGLVARYGNGGSVRRVYARNGHYNALLLPDEVNAFITSRDPEKQGPPSF